MSLLLTTRRRITQTLSLALLNSNFFVSIVGSRFCLPVMNCEACAVAWLGCPIGLMGRSIGFLEFPWLPLLIVLGVGLVAGRFMCGWVCPMGFLQDLLHKLPSRKIRLPRPTTWVKYAVLIVTVFGVARYVGYGTPFFYCSFCPTSGLQVVLPLMIANGDWLLTGTRAVKMALVVAVLVMAVLHHRSFCKVMCPVGALIAIGNRLSFFTLRLDKHRCVSCRKCDRTCGMEVPVMRNRQSGHAVNRHLECITCLGCQQACPVGALDNNAPFLHNGAASGAAERPATPR